MQSITVAETVYKPSHGHLRPEPFERTAAMIRERLSRFTWSATHRVSILLAYTSYHTLQIA